MAFLKLPVSATYLQKVMVMGFVASSTLVLAQKNDSIKEKSIEEVVVVGYGKQKKSKVTGAVSEVNLDKLTSRSLSGVTEALQGKTPGVTVLSSGGDPTKAPNVNIRGIGGVNGESPLYVVDGSVFNGVPNINPNDIESISVLKDAAAAIYGARASGGVVLITTKQGRKNMPLTIDLDAKFGIQNAWKMHHNLDAAQFQDVMTRAYEAAGKLKDLPLAFNKGLYPDGGITRTDWMDEIFRTGSLQEYNVGVNGGGEKSQFFMGLNYRQNEAILLNTQAKRYAFRLNSDHQIKDWLRVGENMSYSFSDGNTTNTSSGYTGAILAAMYYPSNVPVYDANGNFSGLPIAVAGGYGDVVNPVAQLLRLDYRRPTHDILINPYVEVRLLEGLKFKSNFSQYISLANEHNFVSKRPEVGKPDNVNRLYDNSTNIYKMLAEQTLNYNRKIGRHTVDALAGFSFEKYRNEWTSGYGEGFASEDESQRYMVNATANKKSDGGRYRTAMVSYFGRLNYDFADKYLISLTGRRDGTSLVGSEENFKNHFGNYFSVAGGWVVSKENFFENKAVDYLKLRASYGTVGNLSGVNYNSVNPTMSKFDYIIYGATPAMHTSYSSGIYPNPDLTWGMAEHTDFGLDLGFLNNRLTFQVDYFIKNSKKQIFKKDLSSTSNGYSSTYINGGLFQDKGIEAGLSYTSPKYGDFKWGLNANIATLNSVVKSMPSEEYIYQGNTVRGVLTPTRNRVGDAPYSFYGYRTGGLFQTQEEINAYTDANGKLLQPNARPGDIKFLRSEGNTGQLNTSDYVNLGNPFPKFTYGFSLNAEYANFDFNAFFQGVQGNKVFNALKYITLNPGGTGQNYNMDTDILNAWSPTNTGSNIPRLVIGDPNGNYNKPSDFYIEDGSFLRLKNLTVGYTLPQISDRLGIKKVRIYMTANNLITITKYTGFDPEIGMESYGVDVGQYPQSRSFIFGFNLGF